MRIQLLLLYKRNQKDGTVKMGEKTLADGEASSQGRDSVLAAELQALLSQRETAARFFARCRGNPLTTGVAFLDRASFRQGHVVEICGRSGAGKSPVLAQVAMTCILPKQWNGVFYGGWEGVVWMLDLDCRFDIRRFACALQERINRARGVQKGRPPLDFLKNLSGMASPGEIPKGVPPGEAHADADADAEAEADVGAPAAMPREGNDSQPPSATPEAPSEAHEIDEWLLATCLARLRVRRIHSTFQLLTALKTLGPAMEQLSPGAGGQESPSKLLIIDSIGAFHWLDRAVPSAGSKHGGHEFSRTLTLSAGTGAAVRELRHLAGKHKLLILAAKCSVYPEPNPEPPLDRRQVARAVNGAQPPGSSLPSHEAGGHGDLAWGPPPGRSLTEIGSQIAARGRPSGSSHHREFMPDSWQAFVTHRVLLRGPFAPISNGQDSSAAPMGSAASAGDSEPFFTAEWDKPRFGAVFGFFLGEGLIQVF